MVGFARVGRLVRLWSLLRCSPFCKQLCSVTVGLGNAGSFLFSSDVGSVLVSFS